MAPDASPSSARRPLHSHTQTMSFDRSWLTGDEGEFARITPCPAPLHHEILPGVGGMCDFAYCRADEEIVWEWDEEHRAVTGFHVRKRGTGPVAVVWSDPSAGTEGHDGVIMDEVEAEAYVAAQNRAWHFGRRRYRTVRLPDVGALLGSVSA